jgi:hypothetical protein
MATVRSAAASLERLSRDRNYSGPMLRRQNLEKGPSNFGAAGLEDNERGLILSLIWKLGIGAGWRLTSKRIQLVRAY